ncbi:MAG: hypothetical protein PHI86_05670 [Candidatus Omnitrophica bacterium]|nr:hypothetical protein [Candidatus Omnitrophota bacterium]HOX54313.1 hypothetical protein [Candidatus Omnitrophota bacterium]
MNDLLSFLGIIFAFLGAGMLIVLLVTLANGPLPSGFLGVFLAVFPFIFLFFAAFILTRRKF